MLGHTEEGQLVDHDNKQTPCNIREIEAEAVALLCCASLKLEGNRIFTRLYPALADRKILSQLHPHKDAVIRSRTNRSLLNLSDT
jgi:hypothetical protein